MTMPGEWGGEKKLNLPVIIGIIAATVAIAGVALLLSGGGGGGSAGLNASFTYSPASPTTGTAVYFTDASTGDNIASWSWDFGDGSTSTDRNPSHQFAAGTHNVTLTITTGGGQTDTYTIPITVGGGGPTGETIPVFTDAGLLPEAGMMVDAFVWPQEGEWGLQAPYVEGQYTGVAGIPEGVQCWYTRNGPENNTYAGWGIFIGVDSNTHQIDPSAVHIIDLSGLSKLEFYVKSPINLHVELQDWNATIDNKGVKSNQLWIGNYGWDNSGGWKKITIPKSDIRNVDFSRIWCPFMISTPGSQPLVEWYVDWVMWVAE